jgi:thioester reductase-like protein
MVLVDIDVSKPVEEKPLDAHVAAGTGYSESKWVSETILSIASKEAGIPTTAVRVGQMTGSASGSWNAQEWVPSLLKSSIYLGCIPLLDKVCIRHQW